MSVITYPKGLLRSLSKNFYLSEFECPCQDCKATLVDPLLVEMLQKLRDSLNTKLTITSGYRCPSYQKQLRLRGYETATGVSQHTLGKAADLTNGVMRGAELEDAARKIGFKAVGVGRYFIHVDLRGDRDRRWFYK